MAITAGVTMMVLMAQIARDPHEERQVRRGGQDGINMQEVGRLITQEGPDNWGPLTVRAWPEAELDERPSDEVRWQVMIGNHRFVASRTAEQNAAQFGVKAGLGLSEVEVIVQDWDDLTYLTESARSNRGPATLTDDDKKFVVRRLHEMDPSLSYADIAAKVGLSKGYISRILTGNDSHASDKRTLHGATAEQKDATQSEQTLHGATDELPAEWQVTAAELDGKQHARIGDSMNNLMADYAVMAKVTPAEVRGYLGQLSVEERQSTAVMAGRMWEWLGALVLVANGAAS